MDLQQSTPAESPKREFGDWPAAAVFIALIAALATVAIVVVVRVT